MDQLFNSPAAKESFLQIGIASIYVLIVLVIINRKQLGLEKDIIIASIRMTVQLLFAGFFLTVIFENPHWLLSLAVLLFMEAFCVYTIVKKYKNGLHKELIQVIALGIFLGTTFTVFFFTFFVLRAELWYDPTAFIPVGGMLIGNSMTGVNLGLNALVEGMETNQATVQEKLILGATPRQASKLVIHRAFNNAVTPTVNSMLGIGIVFLPGMMTGQILGGSLPITAVSYQTAIMLAILCSVVISSTVVIFQGVKTFFNKESQLIDFRNGK